MSYPPDPLNLKLDHQAKLYIEVKPRLFPSTSDQWEWVLYQPTSESSKTVALASGLAATEEDAMLNAQSRASYFRDMAKQRREREQFVLDNTTIVEVA